MKPSSKSPEQLKQEQRVVFVIITLCCAAGGAFFGGILIAFLAEWIQGWAPFKLLWWHGSLAGGLVGLMYGLKEAVTDRRDNVERATTLSTLGLELLAEEDLDEASTKIEELLKREVEWNDGHFRSTPGAHIVVGELSIEGLDATEIDGAQTRSNVEIQTCVYFQFDDFDFPYFSMQPQNFANKLLDKLAFSQDIDFEDSPVFSKSFMLTAKDKATATNLFSKEVRDFFEMKKGIKIVAGGGQLIFFEPNSRCQPEKLEAFVNAAMESVEILQQSAVRIDTKAKADGIESTLSSLSPKEKTLQQLQNAGLLGSIIRNRLVKTTLDSEQLAAFVSQSIPREIPKQLKKRFAIDPFLLIFSCFFIIAGLILLLVIPANVDPKDRAIVILALSMFPLIGAAILTVCVYFQKRRTRVLTRGVLVSGFVEEVKETAWVNGNHRVFKIAFQPKTDGSKSIAFHIQGCNIDRAKELMELKQETLLLQDPVSESNSILLECYTY